MRKKLEEYIMKLYEQNYERIEIVRTIAQEYDLTYNEAEPLVSATLLKLKHMNP